MMDETDNKEDVSNPVFDARQQYYKLWMMCSIEVKKAAFERDLPSWLRALQLMYNQVYPLLTGQEQEGIGGKLSLATDLYAKTVSYARNDANFKIAYTRRRLELENNLLIIERDIYVAMNNHNMLLPRSMGESDDISLDQIDEESG